jgi:purine nucleoside permease
MLFLGVAAGCGTSSSSPHVDSGAPSDAGSRRDTSPVHDSGARKDSSPSKPDAAPGDAGSVLAVKVMVVNMAGVEGIAFTQGLGLTENIAVLGLPPESANVHCNASAVCEVTLGMGYANAASSTTALLASGSFDLTQTYFIIAGIGGIDPAQGTLGSAAWARYVVDIGLANEIDAREMPAGWPYGYFALGTTSPDAAPATMAGTEVYQLNENLLQQAYTLSKGLTLTDTSIAMTYRANYPDAPANQPPTVLQCDTTSSDTWFGGAVLTARAAAWVKLLTAGKGVACMSAQEDNATLTVLHRGSLRGAVDFQRVAVIRSGSDFAAPYPGQSDSDSLVNYLSQGGVGPSTTNIFVAAKPLIDTIVADWSSWKSGAPAP